MVLLQYEDFWKGVFVIYSAEIPKKYSMRKSEQLILIVFF